MNTSYLSSLFEFFASFVAFRGIRILEFRFLPILIIFYQNLSITDHGSDIDFTPIRMSCCATDRYWRAWNTACTKVSWLARSCPTSSPVQWLYTASYMAMVWAGIFFCVQVIWLIEDSDSLLHKLRLPCRSLVVG